MADVIKIHTGIYIAFVVTSSRTTTGADHNGENMFGSSRYRVDLAGLYLAENNILRPKSKRRLPLSSVCCSANVFPQLPGNQYHNNNTEDYPGSWCVGSSSKPEQTRANRKPTCKAIVAILPRSRKFPAMWASNYQAHGCLA